MNYQEKIFLAEKGIEFINEGNSIDDYASKLKNSGYYLYDVDKITGTIKNLLSEKYIDEFILLINKNELEFDLNKFPELNEKIFLEIQDKAIERIIKNKKKIIGEYIEEGYNANEILPLVCDDFFDEEDAIWCIEEYYKTNDLVSPEDKPRFILLGLFSIFSGIFVAGTITTILLHISHGIRYLTKSLRKPEK